MSEISVNEASRREVSKRMRRTCTAGRVLLWIAILAAAIEGILLLSVAFGNDRMIANGATHIILRGIAQDILLVVTLVMLDGFVYVVRHGEPSTSAANILRLRKVGVWLLVTAIVPGAIEFFYAVFAGVSGSWNPSLTYMIGGVLLLLFSGLMGAEQETAAE